MAKRIAVITDATSAGYFFPHWHRYYGKQFGETSLHVVTYAGHQGDFGAFPLADLIEEPVRFDDGFRASRMSSYVDDLLGLNDVVIRSDVDEFLVPAPGTAATLREYVDGLNLPYVTAIGLDLVETPEDARLDFDRPLLAQRPWCVETSSLNKTAIVTPAARPVIWAPGFHASTLDPRFAGLYLLHMKFADIKGRVAWFSEMQDRVRPDSHTYDYYQSGKSKIEGFAAHLNSLPLVETDDLGTGTAFRSRIAETVSRNPENGIYQGSFENDRRRVRHRVTDAF